LIERGRSVLKGESKAREKQVAEEKGWQKNDKKRTLKRVL
jgi:hypothetical protein